MSFELIESLVFCANATLAALNTITTESLDFPIIVDFHKVILFQTLFYSMQNTLFFFN